jgi:hypothetical protein
VKRNERNNRKTGSNEGDGGRKKESEREGNNGDHCSAESLIIIIHLSILVVGCDDTYHTRKLWAALPNPTSRPMCCDFSPPFPEWDGLATTEADTGPNWLSGRVEERVSRGLRYIGAGEIHDGEKGTRAYTRVGSG